MREKIAAALAVACLAVTPTVSATPAAAGSAPPADSSTITRAGAWLVDGSGRVLVLHGMDIVRKSNPWYPANFTAQDAAFLQSEGVNAARIGLAWSAVEPQPGVYDDAYIQKFVAFEHLLGQYGIHSLVDFHQDVWSSQNMPAWATLGLTYSDDFQAFWDNQPAPDHVGIQTHFINAWQHVATFFQGDGNIIGFDPFNEPQPGYKSGCDLFVQCPQFESGELSAFYASYVAALRKVDTQHVIMLEPVADNNLTAPSLALPNDSRIGLTYHQYCLATQSNGPTPGQATCAPIEQQAIDTQANWARQTAGIPAFQGEWSSTDDDTDNARMVDLTQTRFLSWTMWMYYAYHDDPANADVQSLLINDAQPGSEANAKQAKLDATAVPYATAIAGTPVNTSFDRATHQYQLTYTTAAVPGAVLTTNATTIFLPTRVYPNGFHVVAQDATYRVDGHLLTVQPNPGVGQVTVTVTL